MPAVPPPRAPRRHHFVPVFYLTGFTASDRRDGELWGLDRQDGRRWRGTPETVGHQRDFYRVDDVPAVEPDAVERLLAQVEAEVAPVLRSILQDERIPPRGTREFDLFVNFIAGMEVRVPRTRSTIERFVASIAQDAARLVTATRERFEAVVRRARESGEDMPDVGYDEMREFIESERYRVDVSQPWLISMMLQSIDVLLPLLARRHWTLLVTDADQDSFVTSDSPVAVTWSDARHFGFFPPAFGIRHTDVTLPLSRKVALLGRFEGGEGTARAGREMVAVINSRTGFGCDRFIWSPYEDFPWPKRDGPIGGVADAIVALAQRHP